MKAIYQDTYVDTSDGYHWLTCGRCEEPLIHLDSGTTFSAMLGDVDRHECEVNPEGGAL